MEGNQWISTLAALKQANKEKDELIASAMDDIANYKIEHKILTREVNRLREKYEPISALYRRLREV